MKTTDFDYDLPSEFIAQVPIEPRDSSRLLVLGRTTGAIQHAIFNQIGQYLRPNDLLVWNETRVIPARMYARKIPGGGRIELLLLRKLGLNLWEALVGGKGGDKGRQVQIENGSFAEIIEVLEGGRRLVKFSQPVEEFLASAGLTPLPPYIKARSIDGERYQTVYAREPGSVAAPTAGLHFTPALIQTLRTLGIRFASVILHIGLDTFAPVKEGIADKHKIHREWCYLGEETAKAIQRTHADGGRVIAVGTTSVRVIESAVSMKEDAMVVLPFEGETDLFILPGHKFRIINGLITNFHLPRSTLIMLVSAFAGRKNLLNAYEVAKHSGYRFYSFGDAMLII